MDREDIIRMALKADMRVGTNLSGVVLVGSPAEIGLAHLTIEELERFAALVLANNPPQSSMAWQEGYQAGRLAEQKTFLSVLRQMHDVYALTSDPPRKNT